MPNLRDIKARIVSTEKTSQITNAMNMVSASKLRKSEKKYNMYLTYMNKMEELSNKVLFNSTNDINEIKNNNNNNNYSDDSNSYSDNIGVNPLLEEREIKNVIYIIITSDKGLAGAYNNNILKRLNQEISITPYDYKVGVIGKYGLDYCLKNKYPLVRDKSIVIRDDVLFIDLEPLADELIKSYLDKKVDKIMIIYNKFINTLTQEVTVDTFLPFELKNDWEKEEKENIEYIYDSGMERTIDLILPMYLKNKLFGYILNAKISEHAARMNAMKNATDNAKEVIAKLQILYNRARQDSITKELTDIVSGANSI